MNVKVFSEYLNIYYSSTFEDVNNYISNSNHIEYLTVELPDGNIIDSTEFLKHYNDFLEKYKS